LIAVLIGLGTIGCSNLPIVFPPTSQAEPALGSSQPADSNQKADTPKQPEEPAKALLEWKVGKKEEEKHGQDNHSEKPKENGNGDKSTKEKEPKEEKPLETDRPDFGVATTTVGKGRAILETGYTLYHDHSFGASLNGQSVPDALLRVGLFTDWFEFRIGQTFANFRTTWPALPVSAAQTVDQKGAQDLYLGVKLAMTEQASYMPESAVIIQSTVPTGADSLTAGRMLPGIIYSYGWDIIKDKLDLSGLIEADKVISTHKGKEHVPLSAGIDVSSYTQIAHTWEVRYAWTPKLRTFAEWIALFPSGANDTATGPQYYIHPGMTYLITKDMQIDAHLFIGMNKHAIDFFGGPGFSIRY
jgi:hypothetical protein